MFIDLYRALFVVLCSLTPFSSAFSFSAGAATQCDSLAVSWNGGTAPFSLHLIPLFGTPRNISIPASAFNNGQGSFTLPQFPISKGQQYMLSMSDSSGFGTGGTTNVLTVGTSKGGSCDTSDPGVDFSFQLNTALTQCRPYVFSGYSAAVPPVTIIGLIPSGNPFVITSPAGQNQFTWTANVEHGTSIAFMMIDANGRQGGCSDLRVVANSDDRSCLNGLSPSSTLGLPTTSGQGTQGPSNTGTATGGAPSATSSQSSSGGTSIGAIAGTVIGALLFLAAVITLGLFFLRRRKDAQRRQSFRRQSHPMGTDLQYEPYAGPAPHDAHPYALSSNTPTTYAASPSPYTPHPYSSQPYNTQPYGHTYQQSAYGQSSIAPSTHSHTLSGAAYDGYSGSMLPYDSNPFQDTPQQQHYPPANHPYPSTYQLPSANTFALPNSADPFNPPMNDRGQLVPPPSRPGDDPFASAETMTTSDSMTSAQQRKAAMAGVATYKPSRIVVHTDADDVLPPPNAEGVVELPPQYTERRGLTVVNQSPPSPSHSTGASYPEKPSS